MALTLNKTVVRCEDNAGIRARRVFLITGPSSYDATNGESLAPSLVKLGVIECFGAGDSAIFWNGSSAVRLAVFDRTNNRLRFFVPNTGAEVANAVDLSTFSARVEIIGK